MHGLGKIGRTRSLLAVALALCAAGAQALEPTTPLANLNRQSWLMENGLPQNTVQTLAQTRDGFVWLGTEVGLARFDGAGFVVFDKNSTPPLPGADARCLLEARDGSLWVGTSDGLARWKEGRLTTYTTADGLPGNGVRALSEDARGVLWIYTDAGLARREGEKITAQEEWKAGAPIEEISANGTVSFRGDAQPSALGSEVFGRQAAARLGVARENLAFVAVLNSETVAFASASVLAIEHGANARERFTVGRELPGSRIQFLLVDRRGSLWIGTNSGLARWANGRLERLPVQDPLATASVLTMMEDREGNLWIGTETDGLHILRDARFRTVGAREGLSADAATTVVEDAHGTLWVGTSGGGLNAMRAETRQLIAKKTVRDGLLSDVILSLAAMPNGDLWVGTPDGLNRVRGKRIDGYTSADGLPDDFVRSLLADRDGSLWIGTRRGLLHWMNPASGADGLGGRMETYTRANGLGSDLVGAMARDAQGSLWVATLAGLSRLREGRIENFTTAQGLASNVVTALLPRADGTLYIGTQDHGWSVWDGKRFTTANEGKSAIHAILDDANGHLWFATENGLARCDRSEPNNAAQACEHWMEFGAADGLRGRGTAMNSHPSAWHASDGHMWFATPKGLVEVDPAHFPVNATPPPVALERFTVDDVAQPLGAQQALIVPSGHVHFQFDYVGLSYVAPQKVRYRYMLEGFDRGWTEAGARRTAYYTNIPPGRYTFRVQAANNDGVWNEQGAALSFTLKPHFYQTAWFFGMCFAAALGLGILILRLRLRRAEGEFKAVLAERARIAREIHDTLAQGYVGVSVQLEVLSELLRMQKLEAAAKHLNTTRDIVREGLAEARQSIWALRSHDAGEITLPVRIRRLVEAENQHGMEASFSLFGAYRALPPGTEQEILRVAQEAIHNVRKHAGATRMMVQLEYGPQRLALEVRDDGRGFEAEAKAPAGHFGLTGMSERAAAIGGTIEVTSEPGAGTVVRLETSAYKNGAREGKDAE